MRVRGRETKVWGGVKVSERHQEEWAEEILRKFEKDPSKDITYILSGDTMVVGMSDSYSVRIYFTRVAEKVTFLTSELKMDDGYCSCGGPAKIVPIGGEDVRVCKNCKKEVR